ncbi:S-adenosyl-L-methionine-dependent methyltransferase [Aspergillus alliaceus]|uniref:S-adenosyl-L-methionine-dependent methyltransferase n=1 Tax=Petromyces alliaceus TaxID=209559 RepID=UPI0012A60E52|nr:S-adenosyl-L-methionine-dependent methyltransferase [Aspergillus alliaceus]KAB8237015.1 S-adenosyl-L-methionine-dependent methyltransferase [Aspergillus alliaceus]
MATVPLQGFTIEAENRLSDVNSAIGDSDISFFTTSIASSIKNYIKMDMLHHIYPLMLGGSLYKTPISQSPQHILDIGPGTGIYALDIADELPSAEILGISLSPIQPHCVPPNCKFIVNDKFDYVHKPNIADSVSNWDRLFQQAFRNTRPGGYLELEEFPVWFHTQDGELSDDSYTRQWNRHLVDGMITFGKSIRTVEQQAEKMKAAGFVDQKSPSLTELGQWMQMQTIDAIEPLSLAIFTHVLGWTEEDSCLLFAEARKEFRETTRQLYVYMHSIYSHIQDFKGGIEWQNVLLPQTWKCLYYVKLATRD